MQTAPIPFRTRTVPIRSAVVNTVVPMDTAEGRLRAQRLRRYLEDLWLAKGGRRHGFVVGLSKATFVKRTTLSSWFSETRPKVPQLDSLDAIAAYFDVSRVEIVAAMDGVRLLTEDQAERWAREELQRQLEAAQAEGLLPARPRRPIGSPGGNGFPRARR